MDPSAREPHNRRWNASNYRGPQAARYVISQLNRFKVDHFVKDFILCSFGLAKSCNLYFWYYFLRYCFCICLFEREAWKSVNVAVYFRNLFLIRCVEKNFLAFVYSNVFGLPLACNYVSFPLKAKEFLLNCEQ